MPVNLIHFPIALLLQMTKSIARMRAAVHESYGKPDDVIQVKDVPKPQCSRSEVLIKVHSAALNPVDYKILGGLLSLLPDFWKQKPRGNGM